MVYFIRSKDLNAIKIGYSSSYLGSIRRLHAMETGNADTLYLLGIIDEFKFPDIISSEELISNPRKLERMIHDKFKHINKRGEWFKSTDELLLFITNSVIRGQPLDFTNLIEEEIMEKKKPNIIKTRNIKRQFITKRCLRCNQSFIPNVKFMDQRICDSCLDTWKPYGQ